MQAAVQFVSESLQHSDHFMPVTLSAFSTINKSNTVYTKMAESQLNRSQQQLDNTFSTFPYVIHQPKKKHDSVLCRFSPGYNRKYKAHAIVFTDCD